jgi:hypothetical protein
VTAATQDIDTKERREAGCYSFGVEANTIIFAGTIVCIGADGYAVPGSAAPGLLCVGRAEYQANNLDNTATGAGAAGFLNVDVRRGVFRWQNSADGDAITEESLGEKCYIVDSQTVALTSNGGTRSVAGVIFDVDAYGVWVDTRQAQPLSKVYVTLAIADLISADAHTYRVASPCDGRITKLWTDLGAPLAGGNATLTGKIGATAITNGVVNIVEAGSVAGQVNTATPTALNAVAQGADINFTVGGTQTAAASATLTIEITR